MATNNPTVMIPNELSRATATAAPLLTLTDDGAITIPAGIVTLNKAGAIAATLAAPVRDGLMLIVFSETAQAHTLTVAGGLRGAGAGADVGTFGGAIADGIVLFSKGGYWFDVPGTNVNVTFA